MLALAPAMGWGQIADVPWEGTRVIAGPSSGQQTTVPTSEVANPHLNSVDNTGVVTMFEPLFSYNAFDGTETPWLATGCEWSDDREEVRVSLREGVAWSDGTPSTADDLVFTIEMPLADAREGGGVLFRSGTVETNVERIEKLGDHEVVFHLDGPRPRFVRSALSNDFGNVPLRGAAPHLGGRGSHERRQLRRGAGLACHHGALDARALEPHAGDP